MTIATKNLTHKDHVLQYLKRGWNVIPLGKKSKRPNYGALKSTNHKYTDDDGVVHASWEMFQTEKVTTDLIDAWWKHTPKSNVGIVTGRISKLIVVDVDPRNGGDKTMEGLHLPPTYIVSTGGGGWHYYYLWNDDREVPNMDYGAGIEIKGDGGYVVAPPSIHDKTGAMYKFGTPYDEIAEAPDWLLSIEIEKEEKLWESGSDGVDVGKRHNTATSICGKLLKSLPKKLWKTAGWGGLKEWNAINKKPLPEKELRKLFEGIYKKAENNDDIDEESRPPAQAKQLVEMVLKQNPIFLHDNLDVPYASILAGEHREIHSMRSRRFKSWIIQQYWKDVKKPPASEPLKQAVNVLSGMALFEGEVVTLSNRVAEYEGAFWYDLCDEDWQAIKITNAGWEVVMPPTLFRRYKHQKAQSLPVEGGKVPDIMKYVNVTDKGQQLLLQVYVVAALIPNIPHPIPVLHGSQGSAKSTFLRVLRRLIDPSSLELLTFPTRKDQLVQQLSHHWAPYYDNVTTMPDWLSDSLCRAVTGEGFSKRELYTDDEDVIYSFKSCIGINGINIAAQRADLLDRSILFALERIPSDQRKDEHTFWREFEEERPRIFGSILHALSKAMAIKPTVSLKNMPRMADFAVWGCAIAEALGHTQDEFMRAYQANIDEQNEEAIHEHPVATAVRLFIDQNEKWSGTATELLSELEKLAEVEKINIKQKLWPAAPNVLSRRLNEAKTNLENIGIVVQLGRGSRRIITISRNKNTVSIDASTQHDVSDGNDDVSVTDEQTTLALLQEGFGPNTKFIDD